jgi:2-dehydro-3-deoxy-D-gluconate 5-dehydrogenase
MTESNPSVHALLDLRGKTAVVTGGGAGIGRSISTHLARAGASVVIADVDAGAADLTVKELWVDDLDVLAVRTNVASEPDVAAMIATAVEWRGGIDILVNNAGIFPTVPVLDMTLEAFSHVIDVNLKSVFLTSRLVAAQMVRQGHGGRIINITSVDALHPSSVGLAHYDASKHGVWGFTKNLALELAPHHVWVNAIAPGAILTPGVEAMQHVSGAAADPTTMLDSFLARIPMGRIGSPDDIGKVALFLASDLATYMTGSQIVVDGGVLLS